MYVLFFSYIIYWILWLNDTKMFSRKKKKISNSSPLKAAAATKRIQLNYYKLSGNSVLHLEYKNGFVIDESSFPTNLVGRGDVVVKYGNEDIRGKDDIQFDQVANSVPQNAFNVLDLLKAGYDEQYLDADAMVIFFSISALNDDHFTAKALSLKVKKSSQGPRFMITHYLFAVTRSQSSFWTLPFVPQGRFSETI